MQWHVAVPPMQGQGKSSSYVVSSLAGEAAAFHPELERVCLLGAETQQELTMWLSLHARAGKDGSQGQGRKGLRG